MELVKLEVRLMEPALFGARRLGNTYVHSHAYIAAGTLKGAIVSEVFKRDERLGKLAFDELSVSNAYPSGTVPAHAYMFLTKRKAKDFVEKKGIIAEGPSIFTPEKYEQEISAVRLMNAEYEPKSIIGDMARFEKILDGGYGYVKATASFKLLPNVAVSKMSGSSQKGMLFSYEVMEKGNFWALIDYEVWKKLNLEDELYVKIGKGRIGGLAEVKVVQKGVSYAEKGNAYCFTPCVPSFDSATFFTYDKSLASTSIYHGWFTNESFSSRKPVFATMKEGSLVSLSDATNAKRVMPAGLNFLLSVEDAYSLLRSVGEVS